MIYVNKSLSPQVPAQLREFGPMGTCGLVIHLVLRLQLRRARPRRPDRFTC